MGRIQPTVTVITPCFGDAATLPMALASLLAQTFEDWECIVIDDGCRESVEPLVRAFDDERMRTVSFATNQGRPVARQQGLELARGRYICMLDADDWYYPNKLASQLAVLEAHPELAAVSTGMAVIDEQGRLKGVRGFDETHLSVKTCQAPDLPELAFSPVMLRREVALSQSFDPRLKRAEDPDYLLAVLNNRHYGVLNQITYAYQEVHSPQSMEEALEGFRYQRLLFAKRLGDHPLRAARHYLWTMVKSGVYRTARRTGGGKYLFERRNRPATLEEHLAYYMSRAFVQAQLKRAQEMGRAPDFSPAPQTS